ncbi:SRPBCC family protein [Streptomyces sp. CA-181903]|uniref:SRPBCC family protein n=1 Tax=Streptomyces sp. CA-181903 TaxID=3240055 RepID=UPI003D94C6E9
MTAGNRATADDGTAPLFEISTGVLVPAPPEAVYAAVSDLPGCHRWSAECVGGEWEGGPAGAVGTVFAGRNRRAADVVAWAPVVRGEWTTRAEVVVAEPGRRFAWAMLDSAGRVQDSVWGYTLAPAPGGATRLTHHFRMGAPTEGIRGITAGMDEADRKRFFTEWGAKLERDMAATAARLKRALEPR